MSEDDDKIPVEKILEYARAVSIGFDCDVVLYGNAAMSYYGLRPAKNITFLVADHVYSAAARLGYREAAWTITGGDGRNSYTMRHPRLPFSLMTDPELPGLDMHFLDARGRSDKIEPGVHVLELDAMLEIVELIDRASPHTTLKGDIDLIKAKIEES